MSLAAPPPALPSDEELIDLIRQSPGGCLCHLSVLLWPALSWLEISQLPQSVTGPAQQPLALWLRDRLRGLIAQGRVQLAPFHKDQPGIAGLAYIIPSG